MFISVLNSNSIFQFDPYLGVVHALDASLGLVVGAECDEGKSAARVEEVRDLAILLNLSTDL